MKSLPRILEYFRPTEEIKELERGRRQFGAILIRDLQRREGKGRGRRKGRKEERD